MPIIHDYDGDGMPFGYADNPVRLIILLNGETDAVARAVEIANAAKVYADENSECAFGQYSVTAGTPYVRIDVTVNNYIPQFYMDIENVDGLKELIYLVYAQDFKYMLTNDRQRIMLNAPLLYSLPSGYDVEIDEVDTSFPERNELSLPDPMEP